MSALNYLVLETQVKQILHRDDLDDQIAFFVGYANERIQDRLSLTLESPSFDGEDNAVFVSNPNLYVYGALISGYAFINEVDMADYYQNQFAGEIDKYYVTNVNGQTGTPVMGEAWPEPVSS